MTSFPLIEQTGIKDCLFIKLSIIASNGGQVLHLLKQENPLWPNFPNGLGEIYFSEVQPGITRAWKLHTLQTGYFAVPLGRIKIVLYDGRADSSTLGVMAELELGLPHNYRLLKIPPGLWYGFKCISETSALICNCTDRPHNEAEMKRLPQNTTEIPYRWE